MGTRNYLVASILQNIIFCVQQLKETCTGLEQYEGEQIMPIFIFGWAIHWNQKNK